MRNFLPLILFFVFIACKKDTMVNDDTPEPPLVPAVQTKFDTIYPNPYLPVYPGSWWKYVNTSNSALIIDSTSNKYKKDAYTLFNQSGSIVFKSDSFFVPAYYHHFKNGHPLPELIWGHRSHFKVGDTYTSNPFVTIVSDSLPKGTSWQSTRINITTLNNRSWSMETISTIDTSIQISGYTYYPTIVVNTTSYHTSLNAPPSVTYMRKYFTKDIGLVKIEYISPLYNPPYEENIVSYHINK